MDKKLFALKAFEEINENETVFIDGGTTTFELAKLLVNKNVKIISNNVLLKALPLSNFTLLDGDFDELSKVMISHKTIEQVKSFFIDKAFFGFSSFKDNAFYTSSQLEAEFKKEVIKASVKSFALGDKEKIFDGEEYTFGSSLNVEIINI